MSEYEYTYVGPLLWGLAVLAFAAMMTYIDHLRYLRVMWKKLSIDKPKKKGVYDVLINRGGKHIEDRLEWTTKAMWDEEKVEYWRER